MTVKERKNKSYKLSRKTPAKLQKLMKKANLKLKDLRMKQTELQEKAAKNRAKIAKAVARVDLLSEVMSVSINNASLPN